MMGLSRKNWVVTTDQKGMCVDYCNAATKVGKPMLGMDGIDLPAKLWPAIACHLAEHRLCQLSLRREKAAGLAHCAGKRQRGHTQSGY